MRPSGPTETAINVSLAEAEDKPGLGEGETPALLNTPRVRVQIIGYAGTVEATSSGQREVLALERAEVARAYLTGRGIAANRISAVGRDYPIQIVNATDEAAQAPLRQARTEILR